MASNMQAKLIEVLCENEYCVEKLKNWINGNKEMKDTSLVASNCKVDVRKFLENLPEVEIIRILESLVKEGEVWNVSPQDSENHDAGRGHHGHSNLKDVSMEEKEVQDQPVAAVESHAKIACPEDLGSQDATDRSHHGHSSLRDVSKEKEVGEYFANQHQPAATDTGYDASEGQAKHKQHRDRQPWEFPPGEIQALTQRKDSENHGLPLESAFNNENKDSESDNTTSSSESIIRLDEESFDSKGTSVDSGTNDRQLGSTTPIEACADDNRKILRASEHDQTLEPGSRFCHSELHNACRRSRVQDVQAQLPEQPNLQNLHVFELLVPQLVETVCNNSKVALAQANRETQNVDIQGTSCSKCNALQEEIDQLEEEVVTLNEKSEQMQEQSAEHEESLSNQDYEIRILKQQNQQLLIHSDVI
ncbi:uncharacterized protein LOC116308087 [Actinia tenebrosa]|uniref:Uncharacterized protein LOC116308087 n=1 Tax=Actinia tenebrosa TaxID=6105 RepID=A0A6P8J962_ACTTE|nr:uncharacterized protein LOC116308087 [Actinia tenebrosa]